MNLLSPIMYSESMRELMRALQTQTISPIFITNTGGNLPSYSNLFPHIFSRRVTILKSINKYFRIFFTLCERGYDYLNSSHNELFFILKYLFLRLNMFFFYVISLSAISVNKHAFCFDCTKVEFSEHKFRKHFFNFPLYWHSWFVN